MTLEDIEKQEQFLKKEKERISNESKMQAQAEKDQDLDLKPVIKQKSP